MVKAKSGEVLPFQMGGEGSAALSQSTSLQNPDQRFYLIFFWTIFKYFCQELLSMSEHLLNTVQVRMMMNSARNPHFLFNIDLHLIG